MFPWRRNNVVFSPLCLVPSLLPSFIYAYSHFYCTSTLIEHCIVIYLIYCVMEERYSAAYALDSFFCNSNAMLALKERRRPVVTVKLTWMQGSKRGEKSWLGPWRQVRCEMNVPGPGTRPELTRDSDSEVLENQTYKLISRVGCCFCNRYQASHRWWRNDGGLGLNKIDLEARATGTQAGGFYAMP